MNKRNNYSNVSGNDLQCEIKRGGYVSELFNSTRSCIMAALEMKDERVIVPISFWNTVQIYAYAFIHSLWICSKTLVRWIWNYKVSATSKTRDNPPLILVDSTIGRHSYVKVKVSCTIFNISFTALFFIMFIKTRTLILFFE